MTSEPLSMHRSTWHELRRLGPKQAGAIDQPVGVADQELCLVCMSPMLTIFNETLNNIYTREILKEFRAIIILLGRGSWMY